MVEPLLPSDPVRAGRYTLVHRLGSGGMGRVYLAVSPTAEKVAVKVIKSELVAEGDIRRRFDAEIDNLRMVYGARVARFEDAGVEDEPPWFAVEYVPGRTLRAHVEQRGPLEVGLVAILGAALAEGLSKIHEAGLLHRDLKPQNIMLGPDGPKVIDFGLAVLAARTAQLTEPGNLVGTFAYMPPEQADGTWQLTAAADVYALGATLIYASTGHLLYPSARGPAVLAHITNPDTHPDLTGVPPELAPLFGAMVAFDPQARPPLDAVMGRLLEVATADGSSAADVRATLVDQTYVEPEPVVIPPELADPVVDEEDEAAEEREVTDEKREEDSGVPAPGTPPASPLTPTPPPTPVKATPPATPVDVGWLVGRLRDEYARMARF